MNSDDVIQQFNARQPAVIKTLKGHVVGFAAERKELRMAFEIGLECCHTVDVVQGGYVTAMLDAAMAHVVLAVEQFKVRVSSIDINVSFLKPARAGSFTAVGSVVRLGRNIAFLKAELFNEKGELTATATSSAHIGRVAAH